MKIWNHSFTLEELNQFCQNTMVSHLGIKFIEFGSDYLTAIMPVDERTIQPYGIMHGGASAVLAETVGSIASNYCLDQEHFFSVGLDINSTHLKMAKRGVVTGVAKPVHLGSSIHVWEIKITNENNQLVSVNRLTTTVLKKRIETPFPLEREVKKYDLSRTAIYGVCIEGGKILLITQKSGPHANKYDLPGGGIEIGESIEVALKREFAEELQMSFKTMHLIDNFTANVTVKSTTNKAAYLFHQVGLVYRVEGLYSLPKTSTEVHPYAWFDFNEISNENSSPILFQLVKRLM